MPGALAIPAARLGAQVVATDISPAMVERLAARARDDGVVIDAHVMDGRALDLDDDAFDRSASQHGVCRCSVTSHAGCASWCG